MHAGARARLLERHVFGRAKKRALVCGPGSAGAGRHLSRRPSAGGRRSGGVSVVRPALLSAGRHSGQGGPHEHGALHRSAAAVSGPSHRGIRRDAARATSRSAARAQKVILKDLMKGKLPPAILQRKKMGFDIPAHEWLRGPLRELHAGHARERRGGARRGVPARRHRSLHAPAPRPARQSRVSSVGVDDPVLVDEEMANSNDAGGSQRNRADRTAGISTSI